MEKSNSTLSAREVFLNFLDDYSEEVQSDLGKDIWEKKHNTSNDVWEAAVKRYADRTNTSTDDVISTLKSDELYNKWIDWKGWEENPRWSPPVSAEGKTLEEFGNEVKKELAREKAKSRVANQVVEESFDIWGNPVPKEYPRPEVTPSKDIWDDIPDSKDLPPKNPVVQRIEGLTVGKPVPQSKPVIPASQTTPPPPKVVTERVVKTGNATAESSAKGRVFVAGEQSASTTSTTQAKITNQVIDDMVSKPSTGAPLKATSKARGMADNLSASVAKGIRASGNLKMLGVASLVGLAGFGAGSRRRTQQDNIEKRLEMQRRGIIKQQ